MQVYLVRHAHAGDRDDWQRPDRERPLSDKGLRQAAALLQLMSGREIARVMSSPYVRCHQTVEPLAANRGLQVEDDEALAEGSDWRGALALLQNASVSTVLCSQGDVIGGVVMYLVESGLVPSAEARSQKASTWVLAVEGGLIRSATYKRPPA